jgi:broad specificity phosphatase PhoE
MFTCYVIRHADKLSTNDFYNPLLRHQDQPLSPKGEKDALGLVRYFEGKPIDAIYVSAYQRTRQTIAPVAVRQGVAPTIDARLNEIDNGVIEALSDPEIHAQYPEVWNAFRERRSDFRFPQGETGAEAQERIMGFLEEKCQKHAGDQIVLVSHDGLIRLLMCAIFKLPVTQRWNFQVDFCGITEISYQPEFKDWKLIRFNQCYS